MQTKPEVPYGFCQCGCGQKTPIATRNKHGAGIKRGEPHRYIQHHGPQVSPEERFMANLIYDPSGCWLWKATHSKAGYGMFSIGGKPVYAHRYSYELTHSPIPEGMFVCHRCDNPGCVNPDHLFLGTPKDNSLDAKSKGRTRNAPRFGADHPRPTAKLNPEKVRMIRAARASGMKRKEIASALGVAINTIDDVLKGKNWGWVE